MADDLNTEIKITANADGVETGVARAKRSLADLGQEAGKVGEKAAEGTAKAERAYARLESEMRRATASLIAQAEGTGRAGEIMQRALAQGLDVSRLEPALAKLRELQDAQQQSARAAEEHAQAQRKAAQAAAEDARAKAEEARALAAIQAQQQSYLASLREEIALYGRSADEVARYRAAKLGVASEAAPLLAQLQQQRAAQEAAAQAARAEAEAQREAARAKQQAETAQRSFLAGLREQADLTGKSQADVLRYRAAQLGVTKDAEAYIQQIERSSKAMGGLGLSTAQTANAMRMVPAQITDIVVSLQSGQNPMTVFLQQGGQLKDMFGGLAPAAQALGRAALGMVNPLTLGAAAVVALSAAYYQGSKEADEYRKAIILTGNAAGTTVGQLDAQARALDGVIGTQGKAAQTLALLAASGKVAAGGMTLVAEAAVRIEREVGTPIEKTVEQFAALGREPVKASIKLNETTNFLTASIYEQIRALEDQGRVAEAGALAQRAAAESSIDRMKTLEQNLGYVERGWRAIADPAKKAWDAMLDVGRASTPEQRLAAAVQRLESARRGAAEAPSIGPYGGPRPSGAGRVEAAQQEVNTLNRDLLRSAEAAASAAAAAEETRRYIQATEDLKKAQESALTTQEKTNKALKEYRDNVAIVNAKRAQEGMALISPEQMQKEEAAIRASLARGTAAVTDAQDARIEAVRRASALEQAAVKAQVSAIESLYRRGGLSQIELIDQVADAEIAGLNQRKAALQQELGLAAQKKNSLKEQQALQGQIAQVEQQITDRQAQRENATAEAIAKRQKAAVEAYGAEAEANRQAVAAFNAAMEARGNAAIQYVYEYGRGVEESVRLTELEASMIGRSTEERKLAIEQLKIQLQLERDIERINRDLAHNPDARDKAIADRVATAARESANAATRVTLDEFTKLNDQIGQSLADALMQGGKSAWEYIKGLFRSQVLAPIIKAVIAPVTGGLATLATGGASAASGGSALSGLSSLTGLTSLGTFGGGLSAGFGGLMGSLGLSATGTTLGGALSAGWTAMGAGNIAGGLGTLAGALGPIALGIGALVSLFGNRNKWSGQFGETQVRGGQAGEVDTRSTFTNSSYSADISRTTAQVGETIAQTIAAFGGATQDFILRQFSATASKKDRAQAGTDLYIGGEFISIGNTEVKKDQQGAAFAEQVQRATLVALQRTVGGAVGEYFDSIDALTASIEDVQKVLATAESVRAFGEQAKWLGGVLDDLAGLGVQATADMAKAAGGFDQLLSITSSAYQVLYSEEERLAFLRDDVAAGFERLGVAMPETTQQLRDYIEGLDTSTEAGRSLLVELLKLAPALDQVATKVEDVTQTAQSGYSAKGSYSSLASVARMQAQNAIDEAAAMWRVRREAEEQRLTEAAQRNPGRNQYLAGMAQAAAGNSFMGAGNADIGSALQAQYDEVMKSVEAHRSLTESLMDFKKSLQVGQFSTLTPQQQYELALSEFDRVAKMSAAGDSAAQELIPEVGRALAEQAMSYFGKNDAYVQVTDRILGVTDSAIQSRQSFEAQQLEVSRAMERRLAAIEERIGKQTDVTAAGMTAQVKATRESAEVQAQAAMTVRAANA